MCFGVVRNLIAHARREREFSAISAIRMSNLSVKDDGLPVDLWFTKAIDASAKGARFYKTVSAITEDHLCHVRFAQQT